MSNIVVLGAGVAGHTAAAYLQRGLGKEHKITVVSPSTNYQWIPSNIWVGVGRMTADEIKFDLRPLYKKWGIEFLQAKAVNFFPEGDKDNTSPFVEVAYTSKDKLGQTQQVPYDFLINATGPKLNFEATEGLLPGTGNIASVCTFSHATEAWHLLQEKLEKMKNGEKQTFVIGTGHPTATCQGAAFEYILNVDFEIKRRGLEKQAEVVWITNEYELGDFGMGGAFIKKGGFITNTKLFAESYFVERNIKWIKRAGVKKVDENKIYFETLDGEYQEQAYDFAMLIPGFAGHGFKAYDKTGQDISSKLFAANGLMKVDADYSQKPFEEWSVNDWPQTYQNPSYSNIFAPGIAFAPPHSISKPMVSKNGTPIFATAPRTGMPSGVMGKVTAENIISWIKTGNPEIKHKASMGKMGAACIVSAGYGMTKGTAATMTVSPVVPDWDKFPDWGRDINTTMGEPGLAGHWLKWAMHYMFLYKAKGKPFWWLIPE
ncbi:MAG: sulfide:quinone reductase [Sphingobacteriia bacterium 35-40-8]|nr:MAG: sulfide:quinone reductase [Sphingobacteriia bacterium 35-40-8]OZA64637.1 MAG: sulfide:quinone reductase [Sphingobacteriia bacterium 39-39-8]HQR93046.1 FAD-dependent oxidoreductase [Sediminibacterium sp.]